LCSFQQEVRIQKRRCLKDEEVVGQQIICHPGKQSGVRAYPRRKSGRKEASQREVAES